jgi:hypothetical protein
LTPASQYTNLGYQIIEWHPGKPVCEQGDKSMRNLVYFVIAVILTGSSFVFIGNSPIAAIISA